MESNKKLATGDSDARMLKCAADVHICQGRTHPGLYAGGMTSGKCDPSVQINQSVEVLCELAGDIAGGEAVTLAADLDPRYADNQLQRA